MAQNHLLHHHFRYDLLTAGMAPSEIQRQITAGVLGQRHALRFSNTMSRVGILSQQLAAAEKPVVTWETHKPSGVAVVTINNPPVNALSEAVLTGVLQCVTEANDDKDVVAIVIQGSNGNFSAGADIQMFAGAQKHGLELIKLQKMVRAVQFKATEVIEQSKKPVVAAVDG